MPLPASEKPVHDSATCPLAGVAVSVPFVGLVASYPIVSDTALLTFPYVSLKRAYTVRVPAVVPSDTDFDVAYVANVVHDVDVPTHMVATPLASDADSAAVTELLVVQAAPPFSVMAPVGGVVSGVGIAVTLAPVLVLPAVSTAHTRNP
jgi:hypothetical protein